MATALKPQADVDVLLLALDTALEVRKRLDQIDNVSVGVLAAASTSPVVTLMAHTCELAVHAVSLWASANKLTLVEHVSKYPDGTQIRTLDAKLASGAVVASVQFDVERIPLPSNANAEAAWSPAHQERQSL